MSAMSDMPNGMSLEQYFERRPRFVYLEGYVFVWDRQKNRPVVWMPNDENEMILWLNRHLSLSKTVWIYKLRADLVAKGRVRDIMREVWL